MPSVFEVARTVVAEEIDGLGHVNNLVYLRWLQDAAVEHSAIEGWDAAAYRRIGRAWVARSHFIEYLAPARVGDRVLVRTWVTGMKRATSTRRYEVFCADDSVKLIRAETHWAFIALETHRPARIPEEVRDSFVVVAD